jgi:hypothetical protein
VWLNPPYGQRNGMQAWLDKFVQHGNGVILLPAYTYTGWWHDFIGQTDLVLFTLYKLQFIRHPPVAKKSSNCTLSNAMLAIGDRGVTALQNAARNGLGKLMSHVEC